MITVSANVLFLFEVSLGKKRALLFILRKVKDVDGTADLGGAGEE